MTQYAHQRVTLALDGTTTTEIVPWVRSDFLQAIMDKEAEVTTRRILDAEATDEGKQWLLGRHKEIASLRLAMHEAKHG